MNVVVHWQLPANEKMYAVWTKNTSFFDDNTKLNIYLHSTKDLEPGKAPKKKVGKTFHEQGSWKVLESSQHQLLQPISNPTHLRVDYALKGGTLHGCCQANGA